MNLTLANKKSLLNSPRILPALIFVGFFLLILLSTLLYKERVFYSDTAYYFFQIVNQENFHFEHHRYGAFVSQLLLLGAVKLHLPFNFLAIIYSITIPLFTFFWSAWIYLKKKNNSLLFIVAVLLEQILIIRHNWFWPVGELVQGLIFITIAFFYLREKKHWLAAVLFLVGILSHPSVIPILAALFIIQISKTNYIYHICAVIICLCLFFILPKSGYEKEKIGAILDFSKIIHSDFWIYIKNSFGKIYIVLLPIIGFSIYVNRRKAIFLSVSFIFTFAWLILIAASESEGTSAVLFENMMLPIGCFWVVAYIISNPPKQFLIIYLLLSMFIFGAYTLLINKNIYGPNLTLQEKNLIDWEQRFPNVASIRINNENKLVENEKIMTNRIPVEYLLHSASIFDGHIINIIPSSYGEIDDNNIYLGIGLPVVKRLELNQHYFKTPAKVDSIVID